MRCEKPRQTNLTGLSDRVISPGFWVCSSCYTSIIGHYSHYMQLKALLR